MVDDEKLIITTILGSQLKVKVEPAWPGMIPIDEDSLAKARCWSDFLMERDRNLRKVDLSVETMVQEMKRKYDILQPLTKLRLTVPITQTSEIIHYGIDSIVINYVPDHFKKDSFMSGNQMRVFFCKTDIEYGLLVQDKEIVSRMVLVEWLVKDGKWIVDRSRGDGARCREDSNNDKNDGDNGNGKVNGDGLSVMDMDEDVDGDVDEDGLVLTCAMDNF